MRLSDKIKNRGNCLEIQQFPFLYKNMACYGLSIRIEKLKCAVQIKMACCHLRKNIDTLWPSLTHTNYVQFNIINTKELGGS